MLTPPSVPPSNRTIPDAWLPAARVGWLIYALVVLTIHILGTPLYVADLQSPESFTIGAWERPTLGDAAVLPTLGLSLPGYARYITAWALLYGAGLFAAGVFVFWRRSHEVVTLIVSLTLLSQSLGENSIDYVLAHQHSLWNWIVEFNQMSGAVLLLWIGYLFPNGRLVPRWTKWLLIGWGIMNFLWFLFPEIPLNHLYGNTAERHPLTTFVLITGCYLTGLYAQIYRYRHVSSAEEQAQTRWVLFGFGANFLNTTIRYLPLAISSALNDPGIPRLMHILVGFPLANLAGMISPATLIVALLRYRLWLIDPILNRAMVYTLLTAAITGIYLLGLWIVQRLFPDSGVAIFVATAVAALLLAPLRNRFQRIVDRSFQRQQIDVQTAFRTLQQEIRTLIALPDLLERIVARLTELLHATHGAIYLADETGQFSLSAERAPVAGLPAQLSLDKTQRQRLQDGSSLPAKTNNPFALLVPLSAPQTDDPSALVGLLALGRRQNGQPYSREDQLLLETLGAQAGTAIVVAKLVAEEQTRTAWRNSAAGQAAQLATRLPAELHQLLPELHAIATRAHDDLETANLLRHLADALRQAGNPTAASVAQGYYFLTSSEREPALLAVGLRTLINGLQEAPNNANQGAIRFQQWLSVLLDALQVETLSQIVSAIAQAGGNNLLADGNPAAEARLGCDLLQKAALPLTSFGQLALVDEQLSLLVQMLDRLQRAERECEASLSPPIHTIVSGVVEHWRTIITHHAATLRRQARLEATLTSRRIFWAETLTVLLTLHNHGRGQASDLEIALQVGEEQESPGAELQTGEQRLAKLIPGESAQLAFTVAADNCQQLPLRFEIRYNDEEGSARQLIHRDRLQILPLSGSHQPIPNPYVAGAPLRPHSATFVGRQGDLRFIRDTLMAGEGNVALVLTGERRMGKTSLLQQLSVQLRDAFAPVYLDCQALAIEPGLGRFLFDVAEAIALAVQLPTHGTTSFGDRPSVVFEREFLPQVQQALGERRLLLLFDEFEELQARVQRGRLEPEIFPYLRHLIQHSGNLAVLFAGTHRLNELDPDYWSAFFNVAHYRRIGHLSAADASSLITIPVTPMLHYDDLALEQMLRVTGGHPYFLQLLCHVLVNHANHEVRSYVTLPQVHQAVEETLGLAESHLLYLYSSIPDTAKVVLAAAATVGQDGAAFDVAAISRQLATQRQRAVHETPTETEIAQMLVHLAEKEVLQPIHYEKSQYRFTLELLRRWIVANRGL